MWGPFYKGDTKEVEKIQRRATKLVPQTRNLPYEEQLKKLNFSSLTHCRRSPHKLVTGRMNLNKQYFFKAPHSTMRGHKYKIFKEHATKFTRINSFSNRIVRDWNELTSDIVGAPSTNTFKHKLGATGRKMDMIHHFSISSRYLQASSISLTKIHYLILSIIVKIHSRRV